MAIKELLKEELGNSLRMERDYSRALSRLPRGSLVRKVVAGHAYHYLAFREGKRVRFQYQGKADEKRDEKYRESRKNRVQYRRLLAQVRAQIKFLKKAVHAKPAI